MAAFRGVGLGDEVFELKGFINALLRKKDDGPVANLKSATLWMQELPEDNIQEALDAIVDAVVSVNENGAIRLGDRVRVLMYLDEKAAPMQESLCRDYIAHCSEHNPPESLNLPTILSFWEEMAAGYHLCIRTFAQNPARRKIWEQLPLLTARAIRCYAMQAKWCHMRYLPVESQVWRQLHRLYLLAEREHFERMPLRLHPRARWDTTCSAEYLQPLMLQLANPESLLPIQVDMADLWLDGWTQAMALETAFRPQRQLYAANLAEGEAAKKLRRNMLGETYRYWDIHPLLERIAAVTESLRHGELPARLGLSEDCRLPVCLDLIELLTARWSGKGATRRHERRKNLKSLHVALGLPALLEQLGTGARKKPPPAAGGPNTDYRLEGIAAPSPAPGDSMELFDGTLPGWTLENESLSGYAVAFEQGTNNRPGIGMLIGLWPTAKTFAVGVVRRVNKDLSGRISLGIETLALSPIPVRLRPPPATAVGGTALDALYLPGLPEREVARSMLIPATAYARGRVMELKALGKGYTIRFQRLLEQGEDYARVQFAVLGVGRY